MGGGVSTVNATVTARRSNFTRNIARLEGGGLRVSYLSRASLDACRVAFNEGDVFVFDLLYLCSILLRICIPNVELL